MNKLFKKYIILKKLTQNCASITVKGTNEAAPAIHNLTQNDQINPSRETAFCSLWSDFWLAVWTGTILPALVCWIDGFTRMRTSADWRWNPVFHFLGFFFWNANWTIHIHHASSWGFYLAVFFGILYSLLLIIAYVSVCERVCVFVDAVYECSKTRFYHFLELVLLQTPEAIPQPRLPLILNECSNRCWGYSQYFSKFNSSHIYFTYIKSISRI